MTILRFRGRREALPYNSKMYKNKIIEYLEARDYFIISISEVESDFPDIVFRHHFKSEENWLEVKATSVSLEEAEFVKQLSVYLVKYLQRTKENRFRFWLAAFKLVSDSFEKIFDDLDENAIRDLIQRMISKSEEQQSIIIENADFYEIRQFFETSTIIEGDPLDVDRTREKISPEAPTTPKLDDVEYAANITNNFNNIEPVIEEHSGYVNLFPLVLPEKISMATTPYRDHLDIYNTNPQVRFPAFRLENKFLFSFEDLDKSILRRYVNVHTIEMKKVEVWISEDKENGNILTHILNKWVDNCCRNDGMWHDKRTRTYFFRKPRGKARSFSKTWVSPKNIKKSRTVTKPYIKDGRINFWGHRSVQVRVLKKWGDYYLRIRPRRLFSEDGLNILEGEKADKLDRAFRRSLYNRNKTLLYDMLFWYDVLFKHTSKSTLGRLDKYTSLDISPNIEVLNCIEFKLSRKPNSEIEEIQEMDDSDMVLKLDDFGR